MNIVVTGATGFIGTTLVQSLERQGSLDIFCANSKTERDELTAAVAKTDVIYHLAGNAHTNGSAHDYEQDISLAQALCEAARASEKEQLLVLSSSVWASGEGRFKDSLYAEIKSRIEEAFLDVARAESPKKTVFVYRLSNVFGEKHPNKLGTAVANFCVAQAQGDNVCINDPAVMLTLCYRQDVVDAFVRSIDSWKAGAPSGYRDIEPVFTISVGDLARKIAHIANLNEGANPSFDTASLDNRLYKVYQSYKENEIA